MDSQTTLMDEELALLPWKGGNSDGDYALPREKSAVGSASVAEWQEIPASDETAVCQIPALELFSQACSSYIDCDMGAPAEWNSNPPMLSMSEFAVDGSPNTLHVPIADGKSVDAALPLLLDELEAFIARLRDESENEVFSVERV
jgi:hypothetical protein